MIHRNQQNIYFRFVSRSFERSIERRPDATDYSPQFDLELLQLQRAVKLTDSYKQRSCRTEAQ